jgi:putative transposase
MALPYLYLKGISSGDFAEVMPVLLGKDANGFSADAVLRLRKQWKEELNQWQKRRLESKSYVYMWVDGIYFQARMEHDSQSMLAGQLLKARRNWLASLMAIGKVPKAGESSCLI